MAARDEIVAYADGLLDVAGYRDALPLGLQVPGAEDVRRIVPGVSASLELFRRAAAAGAQMLLVHHGMFWDWDPRRIGARERDRLRLLFEHDLSLVAYHLPLDGHPELGNNAILCRRLGLADPVPFAEHGGRAIGCLADGGGITVDELLERVRREVNPEPLVFRSGPAAVRRVGIVSGGAASDMEAAIAAGADVFLTGEPKEHVMAHAAEAGIHFVAAGHYATEVFGVRALGDHLAERFGLEHRFVDLPNPI